MGHDLAKHAGDKVRKALNDVHQVAGDPNEMLQIAIMGAGVCIGQACGVLHGLMIAEGHKTTEREVKEHVIGLLRTLTIDGAEALWNELNAGVKP